MAHVARRLAAGPVADEPDLRTAEARRGRSKGSPAIDWPSAIEHIRAVGARLRRSLDRTEEAERRAEAAEAAAAAALMRADRAEERLRQAEARARLAEDRADVAEAAEAEARIWLRRTYACLETACATVEAKTP